MQKLITDNMALVPPIARRYARDAVGCEYEDLAQTGYLALCVAAERYDPDHDAAFSTFATAYIEGEIQHALRDCLPPDDDENDEENNDDNNDDKNDYNATYAKGEPLEAADDIPCDEKQEADQTLLARERREIINLLMNQLTHREWEVVHLYYLQGLTQEEIARQLNLKQHTVCETLDRAIERMRDFATKNNIEW